jgi:hypothetical protein
MVAISSWLARVDLVMDLFSLSSVCSSTGTGTGTGTGTWFC